MTGPNEIRDSSIHPGRTANPEPQRPSHPNQAEHPAHLPAEDAVSLSPVSQELDSVQKAISHLPEIRKERTEQIRQALDSGTYHVSSEQVADRIIQETIRNSSQHPE